jgi:hypothetical protein
MAQLIYSRVIMCPTSLRVIDLFIIGDIREGRMGGLCAFVLRNSKGRIEWLVLLNAPIYLLPDIRCLHS